MDPHSGVGRPWSPQQQKPAPRTKPAASPPAVSPPPAAAGVLQQQQQEEVDAPPPPPPPQVVVDRAPGVPQAIETSLTAISLQWAPVACTVVSQTPAAVEYMVNYELQMQQVDDKGVLHPERWSVQYTGTASFVQVKGLRPGRSYAARVMAVPHVTNMQDVVVVPSPPSNTQLMQTLPCPPMGQPAPQLASRLKKELKFKWGEPEETGGRPLEYALEMSPAPEGWEGAPNPDGFFQVYCGPDRAFLAKRLVPGVQYCSRVRATNCEGESAWSPLAVFYTQATVPSWSTSDAPFVWGTTATNITLGWPEPASNGGNVTSYEVEMDEGSGGGFRHVTRSLERQCTVQGLRSGILYKFRVRAENEAGRSLWSPLGEGCTAAVSPGPCSAPTMLGTSQTSLTVRWEGPDDDGGSPVLYHQVEVRPRCAAARNGLADDWAVHYQGPEKACTIGGLRAGCSYMARVAAVSQAGAGAFSPVAILHTAPSTPGCPGPPSAVSRQQTELSVSWAAPEHDGGSPISTYRLEMCCLGGMEGQRCNGVKGKGKVDPPYELAYLGPERSAVLSGLEPGHRYALRCSAINEQGSSGCGHTTHIDTLPGLPFPVDSLHLLVAAATSLKLQWSQPYGQGAPVTSYVLEMATTLPPPPTVTPRQQAPPAPLLEPASEAHLAAGIGGEQKQQQLEQEGQHANRLLKSNSSSLDAYFRPVYQGTDSTCTVSGLEAYCEYSFRVRAVSCVGGSVSEVEAFRTAPAPPASPSALDHHHATPSSLVLSWLPPAADHGAPVTGYQLECARSSSRATSAAPQAWKLVHQGVGLAAQVGGLEAGSRYLARVRAGNACGWGPWSEPLPCTTAPDFPEAPLGLAAKAVGTMVRASWEAAEDNGALIQAYELEMAGGSGSGGGDFALVFCGEATTHRVQGLQANSSYQFRVRAVNAVGAGPYSALSLVQTSKSPPLPPTQVWVQAADGGSSPSNIEVRWEPAQQGAQEAACISFEVESAPPSSAVRKICAGSTTHVLLSGLQPGGTYPVRVRAIGADGAGHGAWSTPAPVSLRALRREETAAARSSVAVAAPVAGDGEPAHKAQKRRGERGAAAQQPRTVLVVKTAAAKGRPNKDGYLSRGCRHLIRMVGTWNLLMALLAFALVLVFQHIYLPPPALAA